MFGQSLLSAFGSAACTTDTDQLFLGTIQDTTLATYQLNNATTSIPSNTYPGTASNVTYATGKFGNAAVFSSSGSSILSVPRSFSAASSYSVSAWMKHTLSSGYTFMTFFWQNLGTDEIAFFYEGDTDKIILRHKFKTNSDVEYTFSSRPTGWNHYAATFNGSTGTIYVNGTQVASSALDPKADINNTVYVGGGYTYNYNYYYRDGEFDQVRFFNTALPQAAITALYNETTTTATYDYVEYEGPNPNSIAYYKMSDATDQLGNYNGTAGNVNFNTVGKFGFAGAFNGSDSYVSLPAGINKNNNFSWSFWINFTSMTQYDTPIGFFMNGSTNFIDMLSVGRLSLYDGNSRLTTPNSTFATGNWYHVVLTKSSTAGRKFYVNGLEVASDSVNTNSGGTTGGRNLFGAYSSGGNPTTAAFALDGKMDQIRIYDSAISAENVTALYNEIECPETEFLANYLVIAGGGGTTHGQGSGGGAGGYRTSYGTSGGGTSAETILRLDKSVAHTVTVGAGGIGNQGSNQLLGGQGQDSIFSGITSAGGGKGTAQSVGYPNGPGGQLGGSGSGGARFQNTPGAGTANQGFAGGAGNDSANGYAGGGGGGASSVGIAANSTSAGNGGNGISSTITGTAVSRAGGGGGTVYDGAIGVGTSGGGSGGTSFNTPFTAPTPGTANTGGGGGGGNDASKGQDGGSGVVILRYNTANVSSFAVTGTLNTPTPSIVGTDSVLIFTTGTGTVTFS